MTSNDAQIDVLLRRYAGQSQSNSATEHLDADELNAFAEGSLPEASRSRYVSHLADCDDCRKVVSQLAISSGAVVAPEATRTAGSPGYSWWKRLSGFFSPLTLRYAAFAIVLVTVVGVIFLFTRRPPESALIAQNEPAKQTQVEAVKAPDAAPPGGSNQNGAVKPDQSITNPQGAATPMVSKPEEFKGGQIPAPPPKLEQETSETTSPALAAKKAAEPVIAESSPSYAPPPPGEAGREEQKSRDRLDVQRDVATGPRKSEPPSDKLKMMDRSRAGEMSKDVRAADDLNRAAVNQPSTVLRSGADEKAAPGREANTRSKDSNAKEGRGQAAATQSAGAGSRTASEEAPQTRSAGGRKFRRQGNAWVDAKFKSSMTVKSVARGSSEFDALDSGLRSIAQQLGGEVIVVWKNKAYLIK
jgi:hypothetical protein